MPKLERSQVFISYSHKDKKWLQKLHTHLKPFERTNNIQIWDDTKITAGARWKDEIKTALASAKVAILLVTPHFLASEFIAGHELPPLLDAAEKEGLVILWLAISASAYSETEIKNYQAVNDPNKPLSSLRVADQDVIFVKLCNQIKTIARPLIESSFNCTTDETNIIVNDTNKLEPQIALPYEIPGITEDGPVPLGSRFYISRPSDYALQFAINQRYSIILLKGPSQFGKTSTLARGMQSAREAGCKIILTDFQRLSIANLQSVERLFITLGEAIADQLGLDISPEGFWNSRHGPHVNFERYMRHVLRDNVSAHVVWGLDEVDRLLTYSYAPEVFGLFRSWHNQRPLDPSGPWERLTLVLACCTEAHLFIRDTNQSPFNVGTRLTLEEFTLEQISELNQLCSSPLLGMAELERFSRFVGGHPYLVSRGLREMVARGTDLPTFEKTVLQDEMPFGNHLHHLLDLLEQSPTLCEAVREVLQGNPCSTSESFYILRSAGILSGHNRFDSKLCCELYASFFRRHLL